MITLDPDRLAFEAAAGKKVSATIAVTNEGEKERAFQVDRSTTLRTASALANGVKSAFSSPNEDFSDRLIALGTHLASAQSISVQIDATTRDETLPAGGTTTVTLLLGMPDAVEPDTAWTGSIALFDARLRVRLKVVHLPVT